MCNGITVTRRYVPCSWRTLEVRSTQGSYYGNIVSVSKKSGDFQKDYFLKDGLENMLVAGDYLWCRHSVEYFLAHYEEKTQLTR